MTVRVAAEVRRRWQELGEFKGPSIDLLLTADRAAEQVAPLVRDAIRSAIDAIMPSEEADPEWSAGRWQVTAVPAGVAVFVSEYPDAFDEVLDAVANRLTVEGVRGRIGLSATVATEMPRWMPLLECRMRPRGMRDAAAWRVDPEDMHALATAAAKQLWPERVDDAWSVRYGLGTRIGVVSDADLEPLLRQAVATLGTTSDVSRVTSTELDSVALNPSQGFVTIVIGRADLQTTWPAHVNRLKDFLLERHDLMVYGFLRRGANVNAARIGVSLDWDSPARPGFDAASNFEGAFEEHWAPDAFAVQLLGPGYADRHPSGTSWRETAAGRSRLVEHRAPQLWFTDPFVPPGGYGPRVEVPDLLATARSEFRPLLIDSDKAWASRY